TGLSASYFDGQKIQRGIDALHLSVLQITEGNLSDRMPIEKDTSMSRIALDFNEMATAVKKGIKRLQVLGEERGKLETATIKAAVLEERKRLARDLHDTVSQQLFAIHMSMSSLPKILEKNEEKGKTLIEQLIQMSFIAQKQMRGLIAQL